MSEVKDPFAAIRAALDPVTTAYSNYYKLAKAAIRSGQVKAEDLEFFSQETVDKWRVQRVSLKDILTTARYKYCLELLEDIDITVNGKYSLRKMHTTLWGAIQLMKDKRLFICSLTDEVLLQCFNAELKTTFKGFNKKGKGYDEGYDLADRFVKKVPLPSA